MPLKLPSLESVVKVGKFPLGETEKRKQSHAKVEAQPLPLYSVSTYRHRNYADFSLYFYIIPQDSYLF